MRTPWGDTEELRRARLAPGPQPNGRAATAEHQRRRIFAWMVVTIAREGYGAARLEDLARGSGVAHSEFYKLYRDKEECFLAAVDAIYADGLEKMWAASRSQRGVERSVRAALSAVAESALSQPQAARMALVHVYEVGEQGIAHAERATASFERLLSGCLARSAERAALPSALPGALAGAVQALIHDRLRREQESQLPQLARQLAAWTLSYRSPPVPLRRSRAWVRAARRQPDADPRTRLLYSIAELCAQDGYRNVSVSALVAHAKTSRRTVYERYGGKEECFLECFEMVRARTLEVAMAAYAPLLADWPRGLRAAIEAIMRFFASEPALARLVAVEVLAAGPAAFQVRDEAIRSFVSLIEPGYQYTSRAAPIAREAIPFGVYAMIHRHLALGRPAATLPQLAPAACFLALAPFLGAAQAVQIANETVTSRATLKRRPPAARAAVRPGSPAPTPRGSPAAPSARR